MQLKSTAATPENLARLAVPVNILLVILLAYTLARLSWSLLPLPILAPPPAEQTATAAPAQLTEDKKAKLATITNWHLFGKAEVAKPAPIALPKPQAAPETKLNLKLVGIFSSENRNFALAIISESGGRECPVRVSEPIRDKNCKPLRSGPRLEQIFPDKVILSRGGSLETLSLPKETLGSIKPSSAPTVPSPPLIMPAPEDSAPSPDEPGGIPTSSAPPAPSSPLVGGAPTTAPQIIDASEVGERLRSKGPEALQELISARPYMPNRQLQGFSLNPTRGHEDMFRQLGLQTGDILVQFNGIPLTDQNQGMTVMQELLTSKQVDLRILRGGTERALTLILRAP
ncbi:MAG TPA: type II secretion system protein GspC [Candidatus Competibacteraceae bacterium]|nr:type II secretion system protein GspC [Candidatus Competibacteraceae bacterium]